MPNKCVKCGLIIDKGYICMECARNSLEANINRQILKGDNTLMIPVNDLLAKETADLITEALNMDININTVILIARGRHITRAIDILEILKRDFKLKEIIFNTKTENLTNNEGKVIKVSSIKISMSV